MLACLENCGGATGGHLEVDVIGFTFWAAVRDLDQHGACLPQLTCTGQFQ